MTDKLHDLMRKIAEQGTEDIQQAFLKFQFEQLEVRKRVIRAFKLMLAEEEAKKVAKSSR